MNIWIYNEVNPISTTKPLNDYIGYISYIEYDDGIYNHSGDYYCAEYIDKNNNLEIEVFGYDHYVGCVARTEEESLRSFIERFGNMGCIKTRVATRMEALVFGCTKAIRPIL